jgi:hypothetical protein
MTDEMFFSDDAKSLRRGKRRARRTETCRPCILWPVDARDLEFQGVAINVSPYGMLVRIMDTVPAGTRVDIQLMRDEDFRDPMAAPIPGIVVRIEEAGDGFADHGIQIIRPDIRRPEPRTYWPERRPSLPERRRSSRMHTIDITIGE